MKRKRAIPEIDQEEKDGVVLLGGATVLFSCDKGRRTQVALGVERQERV